MKGTRFRGKVLALAALATGIVVAVYEGGVAVGRRGASAEPAASQIAETREQGVATGELGNDVAPRPGAAAENAVTSLDRARADRMREELRALFEKTGPAWGPSPPSSPADGGGRFPTMPVLPGGDAGEGVDPSYVRKVVREDFFPLARQCYEVASAKNPALAGTVELKFRILGDPSIGGVVSEATLGDKTTIADTEMQTCMKESMMSVTFAAPPHGGEVTVTYPIVFSPEDPDGG